MKLTIYTPEEIKISDSKLPAILKSFQQRWERPEATIDDLEDDDLLTEAEVLGIVDLPEDWRTRC